MSIKSNGFHCDIFAHASQFRGEESNCTNITFIVRGHYTGRIYHSSSLDCEAEALTPSNAGSHKQVVMTRWLWRLGRIVAISLELEWLAIPIVYTWFVGWKISRLRKFRVTLRASECLSMLWEEARVSPGCTLMTEIQATKSRSPLLEVLPDPRLPLWFLSGCRTHSSLEQHSALCWKSHYARSSLPGPFQYPLRTLACSALSPMNCRTEAALLSHS